MKMFLTLLNATNGGGGTVFSNLSNSFTKIATQVTDVVTPLAILALIVCGLFIILSRDLAQQAKQWIQRIAIGCVIALSASSLVDWWIRNVKF